MIIAELITPFIFMHQQEIWLWQCIQAFSLLYKPHYSKVSHIMGDFLKIHHMDDIIITLLLHEKTINHVANIAETSSEDNEKESD